MPGFNRTGPRGEGPRTGRGLGPCGAGYKCRRGFRQGYRRRSGRRFYGAPAPLTKKEEKEALTEEKKAIEEELKAVEKRIRELEE
ncbi:MAG: DUF5320 domain-containing protein [Candidatus Undinarchaeales archaeon]